MLLKKKISLLILILVVVSIILVVFSPFKVSYNVVSKVSIKPALEWELSRTIDGNLITLFKNNLNNTVNSYSVTEFQRGDVVEFKLNNEILDKTCIQKGDTIGFVYSNEEQRKLIELMGNLKILEAEFLFYTTGQKPEDVDKAMKQLILAEKELETQQKLMARSEILIQDTVISLQQYDIDLNELKIKEMAFEIAKANYESVTTGEKPEQAQLIESKIYALNLQIEQIKERINYFTLISPINGILAKNRYQSQISDNLKSEVLVKIIDVTEKIGVAPVRLSDLAYFSKGNEVFLPKEKKHGNIISIDNVAQNNWIESSVFLTFKIEDAEDLSPGTFTDIKIYGAELNLKDYLINIFTKK